MADPTPLHDRQVRAHFGDPRAEYEQARTGAALFDHSGRGKVEAAGPDAARFLHNLSTNDILRLAPGDGCEAFLTTAKARLVAYLLISRLPQAGPPAFWLDVAPGTSAAVLKHLDRYLVSEQVELADRTAELAQLYLAGPRAADVLAAAFGPLPALQPLQTADLPAPAVGYRVRRHDLPGLPGFDVLCPADRMGEVWDRLVVAGARPAGAEAYEVLRIEAGIPAQGADLDENTFAPEAGRTAQAICYTKGCYLGQEPIVMARDRGHINRTLRGVRLPGAVPPGSLLYQGGKEVGRVTSGAVSPRLGPVGLAFVRREGQEPGTAVEVEAEGVRRPAEVAGLPLVG